MESISDTMMSNLLDNRLDMLCRSHYFSIWLLKKTSYMVNQQHLMRMLD